jgi:ring-1,2-phenylacetyl-CoA epoxidase subunit PaaD
VVAQDLAVEALRALVNDLPDPEIPVITLGDLGIVREVRIDAGAAVIKLTPTYSGCPATEAIREDVLKTVAKAGYDEARVDIVLSPAWSTSWISQRGRDRLRAYGIAPPIDDDERASRTLNGYVDSPSPSLRVIRFHHKSTLTCPRCSSAEVEELSAYGSTPCKALYRCLACREPFDYFKPY